MHSTALALPLLALLALPASGRAGDPGAARELLALQRAVQGVVAEAEPAVACVLVSRSEGYRRYEHESHPTAPGKLGRFTPPPLPPANPVRPLSEEQRAVQALDLSNPDNVPESFGSGVVLDAANGLVLTNAHVVHNATKVFVRVPGDKGSWADIQASDPRSDLAVLKLIDRVPGLKAARVGDGGKLRKGQFVVGLANPFAAGFRDGSPSASWGVVSNLRRRAPGYTSELDRTRASVHHFGTLLQTDVRLNVGCSGGGLFNLDGELVALTTSLAALAGGDSPGGYAVPLDENVRQIVEVLKRGQEVEYGFLGVSLAATPRRGEGVHVGWVVEGSPAARPLQGDRLQAGEWVVAINGRPVRENDDLFLLISIRLAGNEARLEVAQAPNGPRRTVIVRLAKYATAGNPIASQRPPARYGLRVDYASVVAQGPPARFGQPFIPEGVAVREVIANSAADRARLETNKIIRAVNGLPVHTPADFYNLIRQAAGPVRLTVNGVDGREETTVTLEEK